MWNLNFLKIFLKKLNLFLKKVNFFQQNFQSWHFSSLIPSNIFKPCTINFVETWIYPATMHIDKTHERAETKRCPMKETNDAIEAFNEVLNSRDYRIV